MTDPNPIPLDAFESAIEPLDGDEFASLVGAIRSRTAGAVEVDPPFVRVRTGDDRTDVLVEPAATDAELRATDEFDAIAVPTGDAVDVASDDAVDVASDDAVDVASDAKVITPADLRERLLYAVPAAEADAVCDRFLDAPARSSSYPSIDEGSAPGAAVGTPENERPGDADHGDDGTEGGAGWSETGGRNGAAGVGAVGVGAGDVSAGGIGTERSSSSRPQGDAPGRSAAVRSPAEGGSETEPESDRSVGRLAVIGVLVLLLSTVAGAAYLTDGTVDDGTGGLLGSGDDASVDPQERDDETSVASEDDGDGSEADTTGDGSTGTSGGNDSNVSTVEDAGEIARNTGVSPTCERSALQVVQIQMNAFRYNDDATNDGIRTARRFASPQNRRAVGSLDDFVELFDSPRYAPMLSYDTARYSVPEIEDDLATVRVVTRANGSVTGRYEFRLRKVPGGTGSTDDGVDDEVDDCWMTSSVSASDTG